MIPNDHAIMMYKFSENRWIKKIIDGELSFSCAGAFISQAKRTGNIIQGDELEGVFARQHKDNPNIIRMRDKLGKDLEELPDGDYIFLRRKSAKLKPIFCLFAYTAADAIRDGNPQTTGKQKVRLDFDRRLFDGFANENVKNVVSNSHQFTLVLLQPKPFVDKTKSALIGNGLPFEMRAVKYQDIHKDEFFIEPTEKYPELFVKSEEYAYQHEARICLTHEKFSHIFERYPIDVNRFHQDDYRIVHSAIYVEFTADIQELPDII